MAKTLEEVLKEEIGNLVFQLCVVSTELGRAKERVKELEEKEKN